MGIDEDADFGCERLPLAPDEGLYRFTDGVTEVTNPNGELYGDERLERCLRAVHGQPRPACHPSWDGCHPGLARRLAPRKVCADGRGGRRPSESDPA